MLCPRAQSKAQDVCLLYRPSGAKPRCVTSDRIHVESLVCNISSFPLIMSTAMDYDNLPVRPQSQQAGFIIPTPRVSLHRKSHLLGLCPASVCGTQFTLSSSCPTSCILEGPRGRVHVR